MWSKIPIISEISESGGLSAEHTTLRVQGKERQVAAWVLFWVCICSPVSDPPSWIDLDPVLLAGCLLNPMDVCCMQPGFWSCLLDGLRPYAAALSAAWSLALSYIAPGWISWKDLRGGPPLSSLCVLMDPITSTWICLLC